MRQMRESGIAAGRGVESRKGFDNNDGVLTLAAVVAHPDDDAYGIAGTVALHAAEEGFRFILVHATDGEGGDIRPGFAATPENLGRIRRAEDEAAWRAVGRVPDRHVWLGYPDGEVDRVPFEELVDAVWAVLVVIGVTVDCRGVAARIVSGLREHRSQHHVIFDDPDDVARWQHVVSRQWHVVAWPPRPAGEPHLNDVFQGLS